MSDRTRPWPGPGYKLIFRSIFGALVLFDLWPPTFWASYIVAAITLGIWAVIEWSWLMRYQQWLAFEAVNRFIAAAEAGAVTVDCPLCGEQGVEVRDYMHHIRLFHTDVDLTDAAPKIALQVPNPPLWTRLW